MKFERLAILLEAREINTKNSYWIDNTGKKLEGRSHLEIAGKKLKMEHSMPSDYDKVIPKALEAGWIRVDDSQNFRNKQLSAQIFAHGPTSSAIEALEHIVYKDPTHISYFLDVNAWRNGEFRTALIDEFKDKEEFIEKIRSYAR